MKVLKFPDERLRVKCRKVDKFCKVLRIGKVMYKIMTNSNGIGLACPQLGLSMRMFVSSVLPNRIICNPTWEPTISAFDYEKIEGCLSFPGWLVPVKRYDCIFAEYDTYNGKHIRILLKGLPAQLFQHEAEHLDGVLMFDHLKEAQKVTLERYYRKGV